MEKQRTTPQDFFLHLAVFASLYVSAVSFLRLIFEIIDAFFRDPLDFSSHSYGYYSGSLRASLASLVIIFPLYVLLSRLYYRGLRAEPYRAELWIRKWLIYLTLFVAGVTAAIDLIVLVNTFLDGSLTARFVLKVVAVLALAAAVFAYFMHDLKRGVTRASVGSLRVYALLATLAVVASLVGGFLVIGSPAQARALRFDTERTGHLQTIQWQIINYWQTKERLPATLRELNDKLSGFVVPVDPKTGVAYEYAATGDLAFDICAIFELPSGTGALERLSYPYAVPTGLAPADGSWGAWEHGAGRTCFERVIDPELYPPTQKP